MILIIVQSQKCELALGYPRDDYDLQIARGSIQGLHYLEEGARRTIKVKFLP